MDAVGAFFKVGEFADHGEDFGDVWGRMLESWGGIGVGVMMDVYRIWKLGGWSVET